MSFSDLAELDAALAGCRACPRLVAWREHVAREKRAAYRDEEYWGRPVPGFGPADASLLIVGLAPAAHGANRTGRMFTGDRSGEVLYAALHAVGLASQPTSVRRGDGLELYGTRITAPVHCAPPDNKPTPDERDRCTSHWLTRELDLLAPTVRAVVVLGGFGWQALLPVLARAGWAVPRPRPRFGHGVCVTLEPGAPDRAPLELFGCYHVSQQNTFTGRLTPAMLEEVLAAAASSRREPEGRPHGDVQDVWRNKDCRRCGGTHQFWTLTGTAHRVARAGRDAAGCVREPARRRRRPTPVLRARARDSARSAAARESARTLSISSLLLQAVRQEREVPHVRGHGWAPLLTRPPCVECK